MKTHTIFLAAVLLLNSCATTTLITSNVPESKVYIGGKYKGVTPYYHKDKLPTGARRKVEIQKEGYETVNSKISKFDRVNGMAVFAGFVVIAPFLWSGTYEHYYQFNLTHVGESKPLKSEYLEYGEAFITSKGYFSIYLGEDNGSYVLFNQNKLHYINKDLSFKETVKLDDKFRNVSIDGFIANGNKNVVQFDKANNELHILTINSSNKVSERTIQKIQYNDGLVDKEMTYGYRRNSSTNNFVCYSDNLLSIYNSSAKKIDTYTTDNFIIEAEILTDNRIVILEVNKQGEFFIVDINNDDLNKFNVQSADKLNWSFPRLSINEATGKIYVSMFIKKNKNNKIASIVEANVYSAKLSDLSGISLKKIKLNESNSNKYMINRGVLSDEQNGILCIERQWIVETTMTSASSSSTSQKMVTGSITLINFTKEKVVQKTLRKATSSSVHIPKLSSSFFLNDGKIYCIYNTQVNARTFLTESVLDTDLNYLTVNYRDNYKEDKLIFHPSTSFETENGETIFLMQYSTRLGLAKVKF